MILLHVQWKKIQDPISCQLCQHFQLQSEGSKVTYLGSRYIQITRHIIHCTLEVTLKPPAKRLAEMPTRLPALENLSSSTA
jgi:hypothetical protein